MEKRKKKKERDPQDKEKEKREKRNSGVKKLRKNGLFVKSGEVRRALMAVIEDARMRRHGCDAEKVDLRREWRK